MSLNKIMTIGRLVRDPEVRDIGGNTCLNFTIASDSRNKGEDGKPIANFYNCSAWGKMGQTIGKYMKKGGKIAIVGDLGIRQYKDNNGNDRTAVTITVSDFEFLSSGSQSDNAQTAQPARQNRQARPFTADDALPF